MKKLIFAASLAAFSFNAMAFSASAQLVCGFGPYGYSGSPTIQITAQMGSDAGKPGLFFFAAADPAKQNAFILTIDQGWQPYRGGLYTPQARYDSGLPATITLSIPLPPQDGYNPSNSMGYLNYTVYAGEGVFTPQAQTSVANRRAYLDSIRADRIAKGKWSPDYDNDDRFKWALIQKDMTDNAKYIQVLTIPFLECNSTDTSNGG